MDKAQKKFHRYKPPHKRFGNSEGSSQSQTFDVSSQGPSAPSNGGSWNGGQRRDHGHGWGRDETENWRARTNNTSTDFEIGRAQSQTFNVSQGRYGGSWSRGGGQGRGQGRENWRAKTNNTSGQPGGPALNKFTPKHITNKLLNDYLTMEPNTVVMELSQLLKSNSKLFDEQHWDFKSNQLTLFVQILKTKVLESLGIDSFKNQILTNLCNSTGYWDNVKKHLFDLLVQQQQGLDDDSNFQSTVQFLQNSYELYIYINNTMRTLATTFMSTHLKNFQTVTSIIKQNAKESTSLEKLESKFKELQEQVNDYNAKVEEIVNKAKDQKTSKKMSLKQIRDIESIWKVVPPNDFRQIPIIPTIEELHAEEIPFLRPNLKQGSYPSSEVYLDVQFRLLREDYMSILRTGVKEYLEYTFKNTKLSSRNTVKLYKNVTILPTLDLNTRTPSYTVKLDKYDRFIKRIKWEKSKRLLNGSLLLFTNDGLKTCYFATVSKRDVHDLTNDSKFCISWESEKPKFHDATIYFDMLECDIFFESYRYTLAALQNIHLENFPLMSYLINGLSDKKFPKYIEGRTISFNMLKPNAEANDSIDLIDLTDDSTWPTAPELGMDNSQFEAFKAAITREISVIQGPPGTGKTYIGIQIAKLILGNQDVFLRKRSRILEEEHSDEVLFMLKELEIDIKHCPILIVCYTNHALDQFLEAILQEIHKLNQYSDGSIIRIGGNSKSEDMKDLLIFKQLDKARSNRSLPHSLANTYNHYFYTLKDLKSTRGFLIQCLKNMKKPTGIIDFQNLLQHSGLTAEELFSTLTFGETAIVRKITSMDLENEIQAFGLLHIFSKYQTELDLNIDQSPLLKIMFPKLNPNRKVQNQKVKTEESKISLNQDEDGEFEDNEDFDLDELMADRLLEIEQEVQDTTSSSNYSKFPYYRLNSSIFFNLYKQIRSRIAYYENILENTESPEDAIAEAKYELFQRSLYQEEHEESQKFPKQEELFKRIFTLYKEGRLHLLQMSNDNFNTLLNNLNSNILDTQTAHLLWSCYFSILEKIRLYLVPKVYELEKQILDMTVKYEEARNACEGHLLCNAKFVGMTTTGAAKYNTLLQMMGSRMVIVEEAAEVLESHIVTSITEKCEHLILIGDHKQLRPKNSAYELTRHFNFDVSLFERLINNDLQCYTLEIQHRMRPEISDLLVPTIYPCLQNHESVNDYPNVAGVASNSYFIKHTELEREDADVSSHVNEHEARFVVSLCKYLMLNGYSKDQITILTTYIGQVFLLKKIIREDEAYCQGVRVTAVDNFQGEENDIILLSLVRSNNANKVGFVKIDNRICVSLSRAKHGMFVIGNMDCISSASAKWGEIVKKLEARPIPHIGTHLQLKCTIHSNIIPVAKAEDFSGSPCGGCNEICGIKLPSCNHTCPQICHGTDTDHLLYECKRPCERKCTKNGHSCISVCYKNPCPKCMIKMETTLKCGHTHNIQCYINPDQEFNCPTVVERSLSCGHSLKMKCFENPITKKCLEIVEKTVPRCLHTHQIKCSLEISQILCKKAVNQKIPSCGHELSMDCYKSFDSPDTWTCVENCDTRLANCGHSCTMKCHVNKDPNHEKYQCKKDCARRCPNGHKCGESLEHNHKCFQKCPPCEHFIKKIMPCGHSVELKCHNTLNPNFMSTYLCNDKVLKPSPCGHEVLVKCCELAEQSKCDTLVEPKVKSECGHGVYVPCKIQDTATPKDCSNYCEHPCGMTLKIGEIGCEHECKGTCSSCYQGRLHIKCTEKCTRVLVCGHVCKAPCSSACPPCDAECDMKCEHSKCKLKCGIPCVPCNEPCKRKCVHQACTQLCSENCNINLCNEPCSKILDCGHPCIGLCPEICPKLCRICNKDEVSEIFFGDEDDESARFVQLEDCGHIFSVNGLNKWMESSPADENKILTKKCPKCSGPIKNFLRYRNILTRALGDVLQVKSKIYGNEELIATELVKISKKLKTLWDKNKADKITELDIFIEHLSRLVFIPHLNPIIHKNVKTKGPELRVGMKKYCRHDPEEYKLKKINQFELQTVSKFIFWLENAQKSLSYSMVKLPQSQRQTLLLLKYQELLQIQFSRCNDNNGVFSKFQLEQFEMEHNRLEDYFEITRRLHYISNEISSQALFLRTALIIEQKILNTKVCYGMELRDAVAGKIKVLDTLLKNEFVPVYVPDPSIFQAMVETREAWYKCPNGHFYTIADCGRPNQRSTCPECKSAIGSSGIQHENAANNTRVTHRVGEIPVVQGVSREAPDFF